MPWKMSATVSVFMKIIGHIGHFWWLDSNVWWESSQIWIECIKPIRQMSDESWKFFGYTAVSMPQCVSWLIIKIQRNTCLCKFCGDNLQYMTFTECTWKLYFQNDNFRQDQWTKGPHNRGSWLFLINWEFTRLLPCFMKPANHSLP